MASGKKRSSRSPTSFRVGKVRGDLRGRVWYLTYHEHGQRKRPRLGPDREVARQMAAQINAQLETGAPSALSFDAVKIAELRSRWLAHHEHVARSSVQTIRRYRAATQHLVNYVTAGNAPQSTAHFRVEHAAEFVKHLRSVKVSPNGHPRSRPRLLLDKGLRFILLTCRTMFNFGIRRRHLPPYSDNPFGALQLDHMPVENSKPIVLFTPDEERRFLEACDDWQFPIFATLLFTGLRPGELTHLILPDDLDCQNGILFIRNRPQLGWQVKTRNERQIPLVSPLTQVLQFAIAARTDGVLFRRRRFQNGDTPLLEDASVDRMEREVWQRTAKVEQDLEAISRFERSRICRQVWRDAGAIKIERLRMEFIRICRRIGADHLTAPKMLRHLFATGLQDANVDPLIRNELMGHVPAGSKGGMSLGMTANYTHTRPETRRRQLQSALECRSATSVMVDWLTRQNNKIQPLNRVPIEPD